MARSATLETLVVSATALPPAPFNIQRGAIDYLAMNLVICLLGVSNVAIGHKPIVAFDLAFVEGSIAGEEILHFVKS